MDWSFTPQSGGDENNKDRMDGSVTPGGDSGEQATGPQNPISQSDAEKNTQRDLALLAAIVESSDDAILSCDLNGRITSWNKSAERIFGYTANDILGNPTSRLASPRCQEDTERVLEEIRNGRKIDHYETWRRHKDGTDVLVSMTVSPICDSTGKIIGASKVSRDITAMRRAEEALRNTDKLALAGRMAASIAHEINNPLESVTNLLYLTEHESISDEARSYLTLAQHELARVSHIASQTLGFFRNNRGSSTIPLQEIIDSALSLHLGRLSTSNVVVRKEYGSLPPQFVQQGELRQVIVNLIGNALDAMSEGGRLRIRVRPAYDPVTNTRGARIVIADTGSGMSRTTQRQIFEPFFTTKGSSGTGLGLWVSSQIVARHKGKILVRSSQSAAHHGTVFSIFLPNLREAPSTDLNVQGMNQPQSISDNESNEPEDESRHTPSELGRRSAGYNAA